MSEKRINGTILSRLRRLKLSFICGGHKYYDNLLDKLEVFTEINHNDPLFLPSTSTIRIHKIWDIFKQTFIDECFNKGSGRKWTAVPYLNIVDSPCAPGSVILCFDRDLIDRLRMKIKPGFFAGCIGDFYPPERINARDKVLTPTSSEVQWREYFRVYQSEHSEKAVLITLRVEEKLEMEDQLMINNIYIDLDNFEDTGFHPGYCYLVTKVITARSIKIEMTNDGALFYEREYTGSIPVCFQACKIYVEPESRGEIIRIVPIKKIIELCYRKKRSWQNFIDAFTPNQSRLGKSAGDYPPDIMYQESPPIRSYRPQILPRPGRHKNDVIWYFDTDEQYRSLRYNFRRDIQYNQRLHLTFRRVQDDDDDIDDDDEPDRHAYYPKPIRRPIEYDHFEAFV